MRRKILAANWKMNKRSSELSEYFETFKKHSPTLKPSSEIVFAVPYVFLEKSAQLLAQTTFKAAAQNVHWEKDGAFTGEISLPMIKEMGVKTTLVGHSERRQFFGETDQMVGRKMSACEKEGVFAILCVGETLEQRDQGITNVVVEEQILGALAHITANYAALLAIAYEPVWAIGTGRSATSEMAQEVHQFIRSILMSRFGEKAANQIPILYGGSMKPANAKELLAQPDVDGGLVGGASLSAKDFADLAKILGESIS